MAANFAPRRRLECPRPPTLFRRLVAPEHLPAELLRDIDDFRTFSTAFKMNIAADEPPRYRAFDAARLQFKYPTYVHIAPGIDYLERAYDDAKYGWYSAKPFPHTSRPDDRR